MTLEEKVSQTLSVPRPSSASASPNTTGGTRPSMEWPGQAWPRSFPRPSAWRPPWITDLMFRVATAISDEARAKHHESVRQGRRGIYEGLTFWSPNINIFRDPRWGRGMETYRGGSLSHGPIGRAVREGDAGGRSLLPEDRGHTQTLRRPQRPRTGPAHLRCRRGRTGPAGDLPPGFPGLGRGGRRRIGHVRLQPLPGDPACGSPELLQADPQGRVGVQGLRGVGLLGHHGHLQHPWVVETAPEAAAMGIASGTDLNCGVTYDSLGVAVRTGLLTEEQLDVSLRRLLRARFRLGMFDPPDRVPFADIPYR